MAVRDKNIAIRTHYDCRRPVECVRSIAGDACLAERHQNFSVGAELEDLVALSVFARIVICSNSSDPVGHPHVSILVRKDAVRKYEQSRAEIFQKFAGRFKLQDWRKV